MAKLAYKRSFDLLFASSLSLLSLPVFSLICLVLLITERGKVFYLQERIGYHGRPFRIWKFTTMIENSEKMEGGSITLRNDWRVTRLGRLLRISKLNELPQLINVLKGDMSVVGPRPLMPADFAHYSEEAREAVVQSKPGLTGAGSIVFRDEQYFVSYSDMEPKKYYMEIIMPYKGAVEIWYSRNQSLWTDLKLLLLTVISLLWPGNSLIYCWFNDFPPRPEALKYEVLKTKIKQKRSSY